MIKKSADKQLIPYFMGGNLTYYPHPLTNPIKTTAKQRKINPLKVKMRDLARLQQISAHTTYRFLKFQPDIALILARGGIPLNFSIINRLIRMRDNGNHSISKYLSGKVFHVFPGLESLWAGMPEEKTLPTEKSSVKFFLKEMTSFINKFFEEIKTIRIFYLDTTNTGRTLIQTLKILSTLSEKTNKKFILSVHGVINVKKNKKCTSKYTTMGPKRKAIRILIPFKNNVFPKKKYRIKNIIINSWRFYPIANLFTEDISDCLTADMLKGKYLIEHNVRRDIILTSDYGYKISGITSQDSLSNSLITMLAEIGPIGISRKIHIQQAIQKPKKRKSPLSIAKILKHWSKKNLPPRYRLTFKIFTGIY